MAFRDSMFLASSKHMVKRDECYLCWPDCSSPCRFYPFPPLLITPPPPPPSPPSKSHHISIGAIIAIVVSCIFVFACLYRFLSKKLSTSIISTNTTRTIPVAHDYASYAGATGLEQHVVNSIGMFKYRGGDGLIKTTDCSVCLNEFCDDDKLRLLPNCSHVFHLRCIDPWLRSHANCPLCRAEIVSPGSVGPTLADPNPYSLDSAGRTQMESSQTDILVGHDRSSEVGVRQLDDEDVTVNIDAVNTESSSRMSFRFHVENNLADDQIPPIRRSRSVDSSPFSMTGVSLDNLRKIDSRGHSTATELELNGDGNRNQSMPRKMGGCSKGPSMHKTPVLMKRSFSSGSKIILSGYKRSPNSVLPL